MSATIHRRCGAIALPNGSVRWRVWAPRADRVDLILTDGTARQTFPMTKEPRGYFERQDDNVGEGQRYWFRLNDERDYPDPCSLRQPDGVHGPSALVQTNHFPWTDHAWQGIAREDLVF